MGKDDTIASQLLELEGYLTQRDVMNSKVSKAPVAWHLDHMLKAINGICDALRISDPTTFKRQFSGSRILCFTFNYIPRGMAKAPRSVRPPDTIKTQDILDQLSTARQKLVVLAGLDKNANFKHPYFKILNKTQSERFIRLHNEHHLKIVRDILGK